MSIIFTHLIYATVGPLQDGEMTCITSYGPMIITACGKQIKSWKRGKQVGKLLW
jgi:hypothetical protein